MIGYGLILGLVSVFAILSVVFYFGLVLGNRGGEILATSDLAWGARKVNSSILVMRILNFVTHSRGWFPSERAPRFLTDLMFGVVYERVCFDLASDLSSLQHSIFLVC